MSEIFHKDKAAGEVRLNKYISDAGYCSRREADRLIAAGRVLADGKPAVSGQKIRPGQTVTVDGTALSREEERIVLAVYKPKGVVCTTDTRWGDETIYEMLNYPKRLFPAGRLDKDSEGLLLMTNDGEMANQIMKARNRHEKEYLVTVDRPLTEEFLTHMTQGVYLRELDVTTRPCRLYRTGKDTFRIVLTQGYNRQIRRMCQAFGYRVRGLLRTRIMNIELGAMKAGDYRSVSREELKQLLALLGRPEPLRRQNFMANHAPAAQKHTEQKSGSFN